MSFSITKNNSYNFQYKNHSYKVYKPKSKKQNNTALNNLFQLVEKMLSHYSKVIVIRIDLKPNKYSADNSKFLKFIKEQKTQLTKAYKCKVTYVATRERNSSEKQHYHLAFLLSGHKAHHSSSITANIKKDWEEQQLGIASYVENPFYMIYRGNKHSIEPAIYRLSYFTKLDTKESNCRARKFIYSKLTYSNPQFESNSNDSLLVNPALTYQRNIKQMRATKDVAGGLKPSHKAQDKSDHLCYQKPMNRRISISKERSLCSKNSEFHRVNAIKSDHLHSFLADNTPTTQLTEKTNKLKLNDFPLGKAYTPYTLATTNYCGENKPYEPKIYTETDHFS